LFVGGHPRVADPEPGHGPGRLLKINYLTPGVAVLTNTPTSPADVLRVSGAEGGTALDLIAHKRSDHHKIGLGLQVGTVRFLGHFPGVLRVVVPDSSDQVLLR
jgi:hypothetical protein